MYKAILYSPFFSYFGASNKLMAANISTHLPFDPVEIFDLCSGTGFFSSALCQAFPNSTIVAIDQQPDMVDLSRNSNLRWQNFHARLGDAFLKINRNGFRQNTLTIMRACIHFAEKDLSLSKISKSIAKNSALCIIERTSLSASQYPIFDKAKYELHNLTCNERQSQFVQFAEEFDTFSSFAHGEICHVPTKIVADAIASRQMSYLNVFTDEVLNDWAKHLTSMKNEKIAVFEEYRAYLYIRL